MHDPHEIDRAPLHDRELRALIRDKLATGALRTDAPTTIWAGRARQLRTCEACGRRIDLAAVEYEADWEDGRPRMVLHQECLTTWHEEVARLQPPRRKSSA